MAFKTMGIRMAFKSQPTDAKAIEVLVRWHQIASTYLYPLKAHPPEDDLILENHYMYN